MSTRRRARQTHFQQPYLLSFLPLLLYFSIILFFNYFIIQSIFCVHEIWWWNIAAYTIIALVLDLQCTLTQDRNDFFLHIKKAFGRKTKKTFTIYMEHEMLYSRISYCTNYFHLLLSSRCFALLSRSIFFPSVCRSITIAITRRATLN